MTLKILLATISAILILLIAAYKVGQVRHLKGFLPPAWGEVALLDRTSLVLGIGPGGYDAVLAVFRMSDAVAVEMARGGVAWLQAADASVTSGRAEPRGPWTATPIDGKTFSWADKENCEPGRSEWLYYAINDHVCPGIALYFMGYGFLDRLPAKKAATVDTILQSDGAYISKRRVGYLIVAPEQGLAVFAFAG